MHQWRWTLLNAYTGLGHDFAIVEIFNIAYKFSSINFTVFKVIALLFHAHHTSGEMRNIS